MSLESSLKELIPNLTCPVHLAVELAELVELVAACAGQSELGTELGVELVVIVDAYWDHIH